MKRERKTAAEEAHRLVKNKFRIDEMESSVIHTYDLCTYWMIQLTKLFQTPTFPKSLGKLKAIKKGNIQRRI